jgi:hypothetical protein
MGCYAAYRVSGVVPQFGKDGEAATSPIGFTLRAMDLARDGYELGVSAVELPFWPFNALGNLVYRLANYDTSIRDGDSGAADMHLPGYAQAIAKSHWTFKPFINQADFLYRAVSHGTDGARVIIDDVRANFKGYGEELGNYHWLHNSESYAGTVESISRDIPLVSSTQATLASQDPFVRAFDDHSINPINPLIGALALAAAIGLKKRRARLHLYQNALPIGQRQKLPLSQRQHPLKSMIPFYGRSYRYD